MSEERKRIRIVIYLALACAVILSISAWSLTAQQKAEEARQAQLQSDYALALTCLSRQDYEGALAKFAYTSGYEDTGTLILYAEAVSAYDADNGSTYHTANKFCDAFPDTYAGLYAEQMAALKTDLSARKAIYDAEQERIATEQERKREQQYRLDLKTRLPYEGMRETYIDNTFLGRHGDIAHNYETENGKQYLCTLYRWYINGGRTCIFVARTLRGEVIRVSRWNESTAWDGNTILGTVGGAPSHTTASKPKTTPETDSYHSSDYSHPEDFYYDYYHDFWDYEDAADYWNEYN